MIKSPILNIASFLMIPFIILFALYIQFNGEYSPGGGFQAGVIAATSIILYSMLFGIKSSLKVIPYNIIKFINILGILVYMGVGITTILLNKNFLSYSILLTNSIKGQKLGIFLVESGIMLTVFSSMLIIYINFINIKKQ